jgi:hypothetical protein
VVTVATVERMAMSHLSVSEAARELNARPRDISELFYKRELNDDLCPIVGGRRLIPRDYLPVLRMVLKRHGRPVAEERTQGVTA